MEMDFKEAVKIAKNNEEVKKALGDSYYLNAGIGILESDIDKLKRWIVVFYSPKTEKVIQGIVKGEEEVEFKEAEEAIDPSTEEIDLEKLNITAKEAIEKAKDEVDKLSKGISQILITLKKEEKEIWEINLITKTLSLYLVKLDAETGEIIKKDLQSLMKGDSGTLPFA